MTVQELARTLKKRHEAAVKDLRHFHNSVEVLPLMTLFRSSWVVSTQCLSREAGFSKATASRILHLLEALGALRRGTVRGHAVYSLTDSVDAARLLAERFGDSLPRVTGVFFA
jgi:DNA-binding IclR family transcriptional regulator